MLSIRPSGACWTPSGFFWRVPILSVAPNDFIMTSFATKNFRGDEATLLVRGQLASPVGAAPASGFAADTLDIDDGYRMVQGRPSACYLPADRWQ